MRDFMENSIESAFLDPDYFLPGLIYSDCSRVSELPAPDRNIQLFCKGFGDLTLFDELISLLFCAGREWILEILRIEPEYIAFFITDPHLLIFTGKFWNIEFYFIPDFDIFS